MNYKFLEPSNEISEKASTLFGTCIIIALCFAYMCVPYNETNLEKIYTFFPMVSIFAMLGTTFAGISIFKRESYDSFYRGIGLCSAIASIIYFLITVIDAIKLWS